MNPDEIRQTITDEVHAAMKGDLRFIIREEIRLIIREELEPLRKQAEILDFHITGNGTPEKGIILRIFQLEASEKIRAKVFWIVMSVVLIAVTAAGWKQLTTSPGL